MLIVTACDEKYEKFAMALVRSVLRNTGYEIVCHFLNPKGTPDEQADFCANRRIDLLYLYQSKGNVLWLDADSLVRLPLGTLDSYFEDNDTMAVHTPEMGGPLSANAWLISTVGVAGTTRGKRFLEEWKRQFEILNPTMFPSIMTVQHAYVMALDACKNWVRVKDLTYHYSDKFMRPESAIIEAQGPRKYEDSTWLKEMEKYGVDKML